VVTRFRDRTVLFGDAEARWCSGPARASAASSVPAPLRRSELQGPVRARRRVCAPAVRRHQQVREWRHVPGDERARGVQAGRSHACRRQCASCARSSNLTVGDIDLLIAHQANLRISEGGAEGAGAAGRARVQTSRSTGTRRRRRSPSRSTNAARAGGSGRGSWCASSGWGRGSIGRGADARVGRSLRPARKRGCNMDRVNRPGLPTAGSALRLSSSPLSELDQWTSLSWS